MRKTQDRHCDYWSRTSRIGFQAISGLSCIALPPLRKRCKVGQSGPQKVGGMESESIALEVLPEARAHGKCDRAGVQAAHRNVQKLGN